MMKQKYQLAADAAGKDFRLHIFKMRGTIPTAKPEVTWHNRAFYT
jgi:hypothetical protein